MILRSLRFGGCDMVDRGGASDGKTNCEDYTSNSHYEASNTKRSISRRTANHIRGVGAESARAPLDSYTVLIRQKRCVISEKIIAEVNDFGRHTCSKRDY